MKRPVAANRTANYRRPVECRCGFACFLHHGIDQLVHRRAFPNGNFDVGPAGDGGLNEFQVSASLQIDINLVTPARPTFTGVPSLRVAGIDDHCRLRRQYGSRVDVPQCPVIEPRCGEFSHGSRSVIRVPGLMADIRVQQGNRVSGRRSRFEGCRQIVHNTLARVADTRDMRDLAAAANERFRIRSPSERNDIGRKLKTASPPIQRIVVAVNDEYRNVPFGEPLHLLPECHERPQASIFRVIEIARNDQQIGFGIDGVFNNALQCPKCGGLEAVS